MTNPEPSAIKQARREGFLIVDGSLKSSVQLIDVWREECERERRPMIGVIRRRDSSDIRYNLRGEPADGWSETLQRDIEGFLAIELQSNVLETSQTEGFYSPTQGLVEALETKHALHIARRLAGICRTTERFERPSESVGVVSYVGVQANDPERVNAFLEASMKKSRVEIRSESH